MPGPTRSRRRRRPTDTGGDAAHLRAGRRAEQLALAFLRRRGLRLVARNFSCRLGEIDLIMRAGACLVFVEIRYRRDSRRMTPAETIGPAKQRRILRTAQYFLQCHPRYAALALRFDLVALSGPLERVTLSWQRGIFEDAGPA
ncbi:MAG: YraN family protein [Gammaproteobacteria bacterium]|nr:MAG: YraN family protein [Gammaproteobacteria bacterium]